MDGFIADREGAFGWSVPSEEQFRFHLAQTRELGGFLCGRRLYETMLPWEMDLSMRDNEIGAAFADVWCAISKVVDHPLTKLTLTFPPVALHALQRVQSDGKSR